MAKKVKINALKFDPKNPKKKPVRVNVNTLPHAKAIKKLAKKTAAQANKKKKSSQKKT